MEIASEKCRVCLKPEIPRKLLPLFNGELQHVEKIFFITGVNVDDDCRDVFPDKICMACSNALADASKFRAVCLNSDRLLRQEMQMMVKIEEDTEEQPVLVHLLNDSSESLVIAYEDDSQYVEAIDDTASHFGETENYDKSRDFQFEPKETTNENLQDGYGGQFKVCEVCGKIYTKNYISNHRKTHDLNVDKVKYRCDLCGLSFNLKCYTYSHMMNVHSSTKKYQCFCGKSYGKKYVFECHQRTHSEDGRIFKCTYDNCTKAFFTKNKLTVHARIHTNQRPYTCKFCGRGFIHYTDHKRHVMSHTGERPFKCQDCPRGFIKKSELTAHQRTHRV